MEKNEAEKKITFCESCGEAYQTDKEHKCYHVPEKQTIQDVLLKKRLEFALTCECEVCKRIRDEAKAEISEIESLKEENKQLKEALKQLISHYDPDGDTFLIEHVEQARKLLE